MIFRLDIQSYLKNYLFQMVILTMQLKGVMQNRSCCTHQIVPESSIFVQDIVEIIAYIGVQAFSWRLAL